MRLTQLHLKNFRCFDQLTLDLDSHLVLIQGANGAGKSSLLEALHYACYLRSFRTHLQRDLIRFNAPSFFIRLMIDQGDGIRDDVHIGCSGTERLVKINQQTVTSFKELMDFYRIITLTEDDLALVKGAPELRRTFFDHALMVIDATYINVFKKFKQTLDNRNALLYEGTCSQASYDVWTRQLWEASQAIVAQRRALLERFQLHINALLPIVAPDIAAITLSYQTKHTLTDDSFAQTMAYNGKLCVQELRFGRSLFGAHLDDVLITFVDKHSRAYASRGQQKLIVFLLKAAFLQELTLRRGPTIMILDDFMTDFDESRLAYLVSFLRNFSSQIFITSPAPNSILDQLLCAQGDAKRLQL